MELFNYSAKTKSGELQRGEIEAENETSAAKIISEKGLIPIVVVSVNKTGVFGFKKISVNDKVFVIRQLATMINAGLPIAQSLKTLQKQSAKENIKKLLEQISSDIEGGVTLSSAMSRFPETFSQLEITLVAAGETSGNLDKALLQMALQLEKQQSYRRKIYGAMVYPAVVLVVTIGITAFIMLFVMPQLKELYSTFNTDIPIYTKILIAVSDFTAKYWYVVVAFTAACAVAARAYIRRPSGRKLWDKIKLSIPGIKVLMGKLYMARFARTLSGLIASGVPLLDALAITAKSIGNVIYEEIINEASEDVKGGKNLSDAIKGSDLFPAVVQEMISVGEKTGELDNMLINLSNFFEEEFDEAVKNISSLILPFFIVILGLVLAFILLGSLLPIYTFTSVVGE